jgi:Domain of unknown function (DUF4173)
MRTAAVAAALAAAALIPGGPAGIGIVVVAVLLALAVAAATAPSLDLLLFGVPALALASFAFVLDAGWVLTLDLSAAGVLAALAVSGPRLAALTAPFVRLPETPALMPPTPSGSSPALRGVLYGGLLVMPFGALFWTADAAFAELGGRIPTPSAASVVERSFLFALVLFGALGLALAARAALPKREARERRRLAFLEAAIPLACLDLLFAAFVAVQVTVLFGGHEHVLETAGLTYSEYAHQGFWQLVTAAVLTLAVVAGATSWVKPETPPQLLLHRFLLAVLCTMTIVVLVSTLHRLRLYEDTYGLTRLRLLVEVFAVWLGVVFALVLAAGAHRPVREQLPRIGVTVTALGFVAFSLLNPDRLIAERNVDRWRETGRIDRYYLSELSADAVPALVGLPPSIRAAALRWRREELARDDPWARRTSRDAERASSSGCDRRRCSAAVPRALRRLPRLRLARRRPRRADRLRERRRRRVLADRGGPRRRNMGPRVARLAARQRLHARGRERQHVRRASNRPRPLARAGEPLHGLEQLTALLRSCGRVARRERVRDAVADVVVEDLEGEALERGRDGADLRQHVDAVAVILDHALDPAHLAFDPVQPLHQRVLVVAVLHQPSLRPRKRRRRSEFVTTKTLEKAIAPAATIGLSRPATASGSAATL